jgi:agmatine deiminase
MSMQLNSTPTKAGYSMPAEWSSHVGCLMAWPSRPELWGSRLQVAKQDYAAVARAIADRERVVMVCNPGLAGEVRELCGSDVLALEIPINDSWARDSGPAFVSDIDGNVALVSFGFNAWGGRWSPHDDDDLLPERLGGWLDLPVFRAPFVLEGGSFFVDGEGTLITTEQCLLNPNRNPDLSRSRIEEGLRDYLGVSTVIWLPYGHSLDTGPAGTDGHVDGVLQVVGPAHVMIECVGDPDSPEHARGVANLAALTSARDARGRQLEISVLDPGPDAAVAYANHYLANGAVIVPVAGTDDDAAPLARLAEIYPDRTIVGVPGETLAFGGGGPHCITQQIPAGVELPG